MSTRAEKAQKEKHHAILRELVQDQTNKSCADCLAKGPRWASWSLGVFICIRCAGIHRNLGVHISKVKSVDLDSWTTEQIEHILQWGNQRASEYYEYYLPKDFTRPQGNHAVESFIRNKYEKKLYIKKDGEPDPNPSSRLNRLKEISVETENEKKPSSFTKKRDRPERNAEEKTTILTMATQDQTTTIARTHEPVKLVVHSHHHKSSSMNDLLSMDHPGPITPNVKPSASNNDLLSFGLFESVHKESNDPFNGNNVNNSESLLQNGNNFLLQSDATAPTQRANAEAKTSTKDSIMSLYGANQPQKMYGVPGGIYVQPQMQQQPYNSGYQMNQMSNQMHQMSINSHMQPLQNSQIQQRQALYPQQQQQQQQQHFHANSYGFPNFQSQNMYSDMNQMPRQNQVLGSQQPPQQMFIQQQQHQQNAFGFNVGQNMMQNTSTWPMNQPLQRLQQVPLMPNHSGGNLMNMNYNMNMGTNTGHTMNNQLWD